MGLEFKLCPDIQAIKWKIIVMSVPICGQIFQERVQKLFKMLGEVGSIVFFFNGG